MSGCGEWATAEPYAAARSLCANGAARPDRIRGYAELLGKAYHQRPQCEDHFIPHETEQSSVRVATASPN